MSKDTNVKPSVEISPEFNSSNPTTLAETAEHQDLVDNPIPYNPEDEKKSSEQTKLLSVEDKTESEHKKEVDKILKGKKLHQCTTDELTKILGRDKVFNFVVVNTEMVDNNPIITYSVVSKPRRSMSNQHIKLINEVGMKAANILRLPRKTEEDEKSDYYGSSYVEIHGHKFFSQSQIMDYYFKLICIYSFGFQYDDFETMAIEDDDDMIDTHKAFSYKTIGRIAMELGQYGWAFFQRR